MKEPNMAAITASLERSLQNCSLNHHRHHQTSGVLGSSGGGDEEERSSSSDEGGHEQQQQQSMPSSDTSLELNSHLSLPYHWEQCLDLKTGEIYYINWRNGMKAKEDPRLTTPQEYINNGSSDQNLHSELEDDSSNYDSEESSSEYSPPSSSSRNQNHRSMETTLDQNQQQQDHVLVVGGCKSCLMYFMVPKQVFDCPKCSGQLLHFDRSENGSSH